MKCKRCGEPLDPRDTHCPVCGRAVGARKKAPSQKKNDSPVVRLPQLDKFTHSYAQDTARSNLLQLVTILAVAVAIVLVVMVYAGVGTLRETVDQLRLTADAQLQQLQNQPVPTRPPEPETQVTEPPTEKPTEAVLPLSRQELTAALRLYHTGVDTYASAAMNPSYATAWISTLREGSTRWIEAAWLLEGTGDRLELELRDAHGGMEVQTAVGLEWSLTGETFSGFSAAACAWEYRVPGGEWEPVSNEWVVSNLSEGRTGLNLTADQLAGLLGQHDNMELRCQVSLAHPDGGTLRILADGLTMGADGPVSAGAMLD